MLGETGGSFVRQYPTYWNKNTKECTGYAYDTFAKRDINYRCEIVEKNRQRDIYRRSLSEWSFSAANITVWGRAHTRNLLSVPNFLFCGMAILGSRVVYCVALYNSRCVIWALQ